MTQTQTHTIGKLDTVRTRLDTTTPFEAEKELREFLTKRLKGQPEAVEMGVDAYLAWLSPLRRPNSPIYFGIAMGDSRTGKSYLARLLAEFFYGDEDCVARVNMNTYKLQQSQTQGTGAPPSYIGSEKQPEFGRKTLEKSRKGGDVRKPIILCLEEIEKAHQDMYDILLSILDNGEIKLADTELHNYRDVIILGTSNLGVRHANDARKPKMGFAPEASADKQQQAADESFLEALTEHYKPEFLNRVDQVVVYKQLTREDTREIADAELERFKREIARVLPPQKHFVISVPNEALEEMLAQAYEQVDKVNATKTGSGSPVAELKRVLDKHLRGILNRELLKGSIQRGDEIIVGYENGELVFDRVRVVTPAAEGQTGTGSDAAQVEVEAEPAATSESGTTNLPALTAPATETSVADAVRQPFLVKALVPPAKSLDLLQKISSTLDGLNCVRLQSNVSHGQMAQTANGVVPVDVVTINVQADIRAMVKLAQLMPALSIEGLPFKLA